MTWLTGDCDLQLPPPSIKPEGIIPHITSLGNPNSKIPSSVSTECISISHHGKSEKYPKWNHHKSGSLHDCSGGSVWWGTELDQLGLPPCLTILKNYNQQRWCLWGRGRCEGCSLQLELGLSGLLSDWRLSPSCQGQHYQGLRLALQPIPDMASAIASPLHHCHLPLHTLPETSCYFPAPTLLDTIREQVVPAFSQVSQTLSYGPKLPRVSNKWGGIGWGGETRPLILVASPLQLRSSLSQLSQDTWITTRFLLLQPSPSTTFLLRWDQK
jgi:hypothetical protein